MKLKFGEKYLVKPKSGIIVKDPTTRHPIPKEGKIVRANTYWRRIAQDGDIEVYEATKKEEAVQDLQKSSSKETQKNSKTSKKGEK